MIAECNSCNRMIHLATRIALKYRSISLVNVLHIVESTIIISVFILFATIISTLSPGAASKGAVHMEDTRITKIFREERMKRGISQKEMAKLLGLSRSTYATYENGTRMPGVAMLKKFSQETGVSLDAILQGDDSPVHVPKKIEPLMQKLMEADDETLKQVEIFLDFWENRKSGTSKAAAGKK